jgi:ATP-binding cassette subfamily B protein
MRGRSLENFKRLFRYAWPERRSLLLIFPLTLLSAACATLQPWPIKLLFDHVLGNAPFPHALERVLQAASPDDPHEALAIFIALSVVILFVLESVLSAVTIWIWTTAGRRTTLRLAQELFARLQQRSLLFHTRSHVGELITKVLGDSGCISAMVERLVMAPLLALLTMSTMILIMAQYDLSLAMLALTLPPAIFLGSFILGKPLRAVAKLRRELEGRVQSFLQQTLAGIPVVQAFVQEDRAHNRFKELSDAQIRTAKRGALLHSFNGLSSGTLSVIARAIVIWVGARHVLDGQLSIGSGALFLVYFGVLFSKAKALGDFYPALQSLRVQAREVLHVLNTPPEITGKLRAASIAIRGIVRFEHVTAGYETECPVLKNVSFEACPGETIAIVSATGGGKTTLVNLIPRLADPWEGRILIDGHDVRDLALRNLRDQVAIVFQDPFLSSLTVAENIAAARPGASQNEIEAAARTAMADDFIMALPEGYNTLIGERGATLSGGMRQRLAIARALIKRAPILILDEPTSALDAETERDLVRALQPLIHGRTTFVVAHRLSTIMHADRILVLEEGGLVESGSHRELLRRGGRYARFHQIMEHRVPTAAVTPAKV